MNNEKITIKLKDIHYSGQSVGDDIVVEVKIRDEVFTFSPKIKLNDVLDFNKEIFIFDFNKDKFEEIIKIKITEKDFIFDDIGEINEKIFADFSSAKSQSFTFDVKVNEIGTNFRKVTAMFGVTLVFEKTEKNLLLGKVALYPDIEQSDFVNLRAEANPKSKEVAKLKNGDELEILEIKLDGTYVQNKSRVWYKIRYQESMGYILSSFVEVAGEERENIISKIIEKAKIIGIDSNFAVALAGCESHYKPYATSHTGARGIFQLTRDALIQLNEKLDYKIDYKNDTEVYDIDKNIEGGIRYLTWVWNMYKDEQDKIEKTVAAWNAGQGNIPTKGPITFEHIKKLKKRSEAKNLVECVMVKIKNL